MSPQGESEITGAHQDVHVGHGQFLCEAPDFLLRKLAGELSLAATAGSDFHGSPDGRKRPGGVFGDAAMLAELERRASTPKP